MDEESVYRIHYRERQVLRASDLAAEQAYQMAMRRRHNVAHHRWGIMSGLELVQTADGGLAIEPGMAVDGYGRELIVPDAVAVPPDLFQTLANDRVDVWLLYARVADTPPQPGRWTCGPGQHSRWREEARLRFTPAEDDIEPRLPIDVPYADFDFGPHQVPPDDPEREWPVYLGRVQALEDGTRYEIEMSKRPYAGALGELITAPSGRARLQVGSQTASDRNAFVVSFPESTDAAGADTAPKWVDRLAISKSGHTTLRGNVVLGSNLILAQPRSLLTEDDFTDLPGLVSQLKNGEHPFSQYLHSKFSESLQKLLRPGNSTEALSRTLVEELNRLLQYNYFFSEQRFPAITDREIRRLISQGAEGVDLIRLNRLLLSVAYPDQIAPPQAESKLERGIALDPLETAPQEAASWQFYRTKVVEGEAEAAGETAPAIHQLRVEIEHPADEGDPSRYQFVIGHRGNQGEYVPCLTVGADNLVIIHGDLEVVPGGQIVEGPIQADPDDPRFASAVLANWAGGIATAADQVSAYYSNIIEVTLPGFPASVQAGSTLSYQIRVRNSSSQVELTNFEVLVIPTVGGIAAPRQVVDAGFGLDPGASRDIETTLLIPTGSRGNLTLLVTALADTPDRNRTQGTITRTVPIVT